MHIILTFYLRQNKKRVLSLVSLNLILS